MKIHEPKMF